MKNENRLLKDSMIWSLLISLVLSLPVAAQTRIKPGMNFFSIQQDVELGRQASQEVEHQLLLLNDPEVTDYVRSIGLRLAKNTNMPDLPWQFKVVNSSEVNAFALPGGFAYVNRGLIEAAETEGQLAGVLAHEISHVTLRHGTNQMSKALLAQMPLSLLGGLSGGRGIVGQLAQLGIGVGANLAFMKFSRTAEEQADVNGVQLMTRAGYNPQEMARMFEILEQQRKGEPSKLEQWFASHPSPENRIGRIEQEIAQIHPSGNLIRNSPRFNSVRAQVRALPPAPKARPQSAAQGGRPGQGKPEPPARTFLTYRHPQGLFEISYPSNWKVAGGEGAGVVFVPDGGVEARGGQSHIVYGAMLNVFEPHRRTSARRMTLEDATDELVDHLIHGNPYLSQVNDRHTERLSGAEAISVTLSGRPQQGRTERVWLIARWYDNELFYIAFIAPEEEFKQYQPIFREMARTLRLSS